MIVESKQIELYETVEGEIPYLVWFESIRDVKTRYRVDAQIRKVRRGNLGACKPVGCGVTELILDFGPGYRIYIGQLGATVVVLLSGGDKSSQTYDIQLSKDYWEDYLSGLRKEGAYGTSW
jgi:putative addiction module killer protein